MVMSGTKTIDEAKKALIEKFTEKSHLISGIRIDENTRPEERARFEVLVIRHNEVVEMLLNGYKLLKTGHMHHALFNQINPLAGVHRSGVPGALMGQIPFSERIPKLMEGHYKKSLNLITRHKELNKEALGNEINCLRYELMCICPFEYGNGRVSRLYENSLRHLCNQPIRVFGYTESWEEAVDYQKYCVEAFRANHPDDYFRPRRQ